MDQLANKFGKITNIGKYPDPWTSKDPWQKPDRRDVGLIAAEKIVKTQISDATKKFDEQLAEILKKQINQSTKAVAFQGDIVGEPGTDSVIKESRSANFCPVSSGTDSVIKESRSANFCPVSSTTSPTLTCISTSKTSSSSPSSEPSAATIKFEEALNNLQKTEIIGKLKVKRDEIEANKQHEPKKIGKRKSEEPHQPSSVSAADEYGAEGTPGQNRWKRSPARDPENRRVREAVTPSTPEWFNFNDPT